MGAPCSVATAHRRGQAGRRRDGCTLAGVGPRPCAWKRYDFDDVL